MEAWEHLCKCAQCRRRNRNEDIRLWLLVAICGLLLALVWEFGLS